MILIQTWDCRRVAAEVAGDHLPLLVTADDNMFTQAEAESLWILEASPREIERLRAAGYCLQGGRHDR